MKSIFCRSFKQIENLLVRDFAARAFRQRRWACNASPLFCFSVTSTTIKNRNTSPLTNSFFNLGNKAFTNRRFVRPNTYKSSICKGFTFGDGQGFKQSGFCGSLAIRDFAYKLKICKQSKAVARSKNFLPSLCAPITLPLVKGFDRHVCRSLKVTPSNHAALDFAWQSKSSICTKGSTIFAPKTTSYHKALAGQPFTYHYGITKNLLLFKNNFRIRGKLWNSIPRENNLPTQNDNQSIEARPVFPFTAIVGQEEMKLALILNVIDPKIGGVMIMGDRGTGKSTTVRALVDLLPEIEVVRDDPFNSDPFDLELMSKEVREKKQNAESLETLKRKIAMVDLPLGATEDRVCGTIDIEKALTEGVKAFEPGLLAKANRGILYVDEVNLLDDHLVDVLLDSAASGWNTVERESISISHPARFILVGSGNPEEGELRPQLLDRFGMHAQIGTVKEPHLRVKIVEQRAQFDESPTILRKQYSEAQKELSEKIKAARELRPKVEMQYDLRMKVSEVCSELNVDGLRGDIVTNRASQAIAAFEKRDKVTPEDIFRVIPLCLRHRLRKDPLESIDSGDKVKDVFKKIFGL